MKLLSYFTPRHIARELVTGVQLALALQVVLHLLVNFVHVGLLHRVRCRVIESRYTLIIKPQTIELTGFAPPELFGKEDELDESALLVTGLIKQSGGWMRIEPGLVLPPIVSQWRSVQLISQDPPVRQMFAHFVRERLVMMTMAKMHEFVHDDQLNAAWRLFCQLQIEPNATSSSIAGPPTSLHSANTPLVHLHADARSPFVY